MAREDLRDAYRSALAWAAAEGVCVYVLEDGRGDAATLTRLSEHPGGVGALGVSYYEADREVEVATTFEHDPWNARMECEAHLAGAATSECLPGRSYAWTVRTSLLGRQYEHLRRRARSLIDRYRPIDSEPSQQAHQATREAVSWRPARVRIDGQAFDADEAHLGAHRIQLCIRLGLPTLRIHSRGWDGPLDIRALSDLSSLHPPDDE